jgi:GTP-binding protein Era
MKAGFIGLVGLPNAGKSTLVNALVGEKVGIVSKKPQTTRRRVIGVYTDEESQMCFIDAPGRVKAEEGLNHFLEKELDAVMSESDALLAVLNLDAKKFSDLQEVVQLCHKAGRPWAIVINKTDLDPDMREGKLRSEFLSLGVPIISVSALRKPEALREKILPILRELLPESTQPLYAEDLFTTQNTRDLVAEIVREKCFEYLHQEVPYGLAVRVLKYDESHRIPRIFVEILVAKENFVSMVVGQGGSMIKRIGASARIECERLLGEKLYLETHVKLKKDWTKNPEVMKELGYVITES